MGDEYGYQRTGRKCREKLDNLYKYYKKTKEGKIGQQEGKNYRFFRQLEALYGPSTTTRNANPANIKNLNSIKNTNSLAFSTSSDSSGDNEEEEGERVTKRWVSEIVEAQMKRLVEMQEAWFEKMMRSLERMEEEKVRRDENWRREEVARRERERRWMVEERAWAEAREASLITTLEKIVRQRENVRPATAGGGDETAEMEFDISRSMGVLS